MTWWFGPLPPGLVTAAFPALATILLREDDLLLIAVCLYEMNLTVDGTEVVECHDFSRI